MLKKPRTHNRCFPTPARLMSHQKSENSCRYYVTNATTAEAVREDRHYPLLYPACVFLFHCIINGILPSQNNLSKIICQKFNERYFSQSLAGTH
jgi:hypothetical protein